MKYRIIRVEYDNREWYEIQTIQFFRWKSLINMIGLGVFANLTFDSPEKCEEWIENKHKPKPIAVNNIIKTIEIKL